MIIEPALVLNDEKLKHKRRMQKTEHKKMNVLVIKIIQIKHKEERGRRGNSPSKQVILEQEGLESNSECSMYNWLLEFILIVVFFFCYQSLTVL